MPNPRYTRADFEQLFIDMNLYIRQKVLSHYGTKHQPHDYNSGTEEDIKVEIHGLHQKDSNKWFFKQCMNHKLGYKINKFDHGLTIDLPMLYSYTADNVEYMTFCSDAACTFLNKALDLNLYVKVTKGIERG